MYKSILVGSDGSATASKAVERAVEVARASGAKLTILSVGRLDKAGKAVSDAAARHEGGGVEIATKTIEGDPASAIVDEAETGDYDLLVVGNKGMTGATRFFLGSVPNKVSHHAPCALLIVRTT